MKYLVLSAVAAGVLSSCGVKGDPVRESGVEPPVVATSSIQKGSRTPPKPRETLF